MEYIHVRNLEKYHPGYKDRTLQWAKIYINMAEGDTDCELIDNEIDFGRLIKVILLELRNQKPLPNVDSFWVKKGFNIKKRPMSLTIKMLHNFIEVVTIDEKERHVDKDKEEDKDKIKNKTVFDFDSLWLKYPRKMGREEAQGHFRAQVKTQEDYVSICEAIKNFLLSDIARGDPKFIPHGSTWFNGRWKDWVIPPKGEIDDRPDYLRPSESAKKS